MKSQKKKSPAKVTPKAAAKVAKSGKAAKVTPPAKPQHGGAAVKATPAKGAPKSAVKVSELAALVVDTANKLQRFAMEIKSYGEIFSKNPVLLEHMREVFCGLNECFAMHEKNIAQHSKNAKQARKG